MRKPLRSAKRAGRRAEAGKLSHNHALSSPREVEIPDLTPHDEKIRAPMHRAAIVILILAAGCRTTDVRGRLDMLFTDLHQRGQRPQDPDARCELLRRRPARLDALCVLQCRNDLGVHRRCGAGRSQSQQVSAPLPLGEDRDEGGLRYVFVKTSKHCGPRVHSGH